MQLKLLIAALLAAIGVLASSASAGQDKAAPFRFVDLAVTRAFTHGEPDIGFVSYYRLNRRLPFEPRDKCEGEEEGGPRFYAAHIVVDGAYEECGAQAMGAIGKRCYTEGAEFHSGDHRFRVGDVVNASLIIHGRRVLTVRTRVQLRKPPLRFRLPDGTPDVQPDVPYEKAFGCLGGH